MKRGTTESATTGREDLVTCAVCGSTEIKLDEVEDEGTLHFGTCERCDHRWTEQGFVSPLLRLVDVQRLSRAA